MKKVLRLCTIFIFIQIILFLTNSIYAVSSSDISISGDKTVEVGSTNTLSVSIDSSETIGVVSGTIEYSSGISSISLEGSNDWVLTYNEDNGKFNIYKAEGSSNEEFMTITYTLSSSATGSQSITINELETTTTSYVTNERGSVSYTINIENSGSENPSGDDEEPGNNDDDNNNNNNSNNNNNNNSNDDDDRNNSGSGNNSGGTTSKNETSGKGNSSGSSTTSNSKLPYTGKQTVLFILVIVGLLAGGLYYRYTYYKGI